MFKIENFDATQIFREINYGEYKPTNFLQTQILREIRNSNTYIVLKLNRYLVTLTQKVISKLSFQNCVFSYLYLTKYIIVTKHKAIQNTNMVFRYLTN